ncbi:MAG: beta-hexosaminidase [Oscillospiraceae bacterium]|nr:beta-hexosaminidase [Oscillospiraceae bacterium]
MLTAIIIDWLNPVPEMMQELSLRDKVSQMMMMSFRYWDNDPVATKEPTAFTVMNDDVRLIVENYNLGAVIYFAQNLAETEQAYILTKEMQQAAVKDGGIPMLICTDQEGGNVFRLASGTSLPGNMALGAANDVEYALKAGRIIGSELSVLGINTNLAPVADINNNANNPVIGLRSYSDDPSLTGQMAVGVIDGMSEYNIVSCAKHFPGHGDTAVDSHYGLPCVDKSLSDLSERELIPFQTAINHGVDMVMTAHILYPQLEPDTAFSTKTGKQESLPATMSDDIITQLLKTDMKFNGIVVTDAMEMKGITDHWEPVEAVIYSIQAGADMICIPCSLNSPKDISNLDAVIDGVCAAVEDGRIPMSRIDDAVERILTVKHNRGILNYNNFKYTLEDAKTIVGSNTNKEAEQEIAAAAVTVLQNKNNTLPLKLTSESKVLMAVPYDNEQAQMIIGWNRAKNKGLIPDGAQIKVIRFDKNTSPDTFKAELDWADTLIFNSEVSRPSAMNGGSWESAYILNAAAYAKSHGKTTIVISADKPYDVQSYPDADAVLAVYGCKGSSVDPTDALINGTLYSDTACGPNIIAGIEVILGVCPAKGVLPVDIPKFENGAYTDEIVFPRGYGLTYN